jgi:small GTP-binding protein
MSIESFKVVLVGESGVGKTSIITQFIDQTFQEDIQSTTGGTFSTKSVVCDGGKILKFEIWDTAGQEKYRSLTTMFYKDANAAVMVYDVTRKDSFEEMKNYWANQIKENSPENIILAIAANKSDLIEQETVDEEEARNFAKELNAIFVTTSAKSSEGINSLFEEIAKKYSGATNITIKEEEDGDEPQVQEQKNANTVKIENPGKENKKPKKKGFC